MFTVREKLAVFVLGIIVMAVFVYRTSNLKQQDADDERNFNKGRHSKKFSKSIREMCWKASPKIHGRDSARWRYDAVGNAVCKRLGGCMGLFCYEYDHIIPKSKGGMGILDNCQILSSKANRMKGDKDNNIQDLKLYSYDVEILEKHLDMTELIVYGDIKRKGLQCRIPSKIEHENNTLSRQHKKKIENCVIEHIL